MRGGHDPCRCDQCSARGNIAATSNEARARLLRIWDARPKLWPPGVKAAATTEPEEEPGEDLEAMYARPWEEELPPGESAN